MAVLLLTYVPFALEFTTSSPLSNLTTQRRSACRQTSRISLAAEPVRRRSEQPTLVRVEVLGVEAEDLSRLFGTLRLRAVSTVSLCAARARRRWVEPKETEERPVEV